MQQARKTAWVPRSSRGIGAAIALRLAEDGFAVAVHYAAGAREAEDVVVHNAGIQLLGSHAGMDHAAADHLIAVNLSAAFRVLGHAARRSSEPLLAGNGNHSFPVLVRIRSNLSPSSSSASTWMRKLTSALFRSLRASVLASSDLRCTLQSRLAA